MTEWYLWEKTPGVIGVLPLSKLEKHSDTYIMTVSGNLEDAIKQAEICEKDGYCLASEQRDIPKTETTEKMVEDQKSLHLEEAILDEPPPCVQEDDGKGEFVLPDFLWMEEYAEMKPRAKRTQQRKKEKQTYGGDELEGQLSLSLELL